MREGVFFFSFFFLLFSLWFIEGKMDTAAKGVMGDPPLFENLSSNNRARRISTHISFGHDHPLPPT
jgi:hypothetical protein